MCVPCFGGRGQGGHGGQGAAAQAPTSHIAIRGTAVTHVTFQWTNNAPAGAQDTLQNFKTRWEFGVRPLAVCSHSSHSNPATMGGKIAASGAGV